MKRVLLSLIVLLVALPPATAEELKIPLEKRPDWTSSEGVVIAWSMEPLLFRVRRDGADGYEPTPEQRAAYLSEYTPEMIARLKRLGVNLVMIHCYKGAGIEAERESMAEAVEFAKRIREAGLHVAVYNYSGAFLWELLFQEKPEAKEWVQRDPHGNPITYGPATYRYYWNRNHPQAIAYYKDIVRFAVEDIQADLIHFDNYHRHTTWDATARRRFREYLRKTFSPRQLAQGRIGDVDSVNPPTGGGTESLLKRAWLDFNCQSLASSYHDMARYAHSLRKDVLVECNPMGIHPRIEPPVDHGRILQAGEAYWDESMKVGMAGGKLQTRIRFYKIARRHDNMGFNYTTTPLEMAEAMAFNLDCIGAVLEFEWGEVHDRRNRPITQINPYVKFYRTRRELFRDTEVLADTAILRSFPSSVFGDAQTALLTHSVEEELIANRACFQIIYDHQLGELDQYRALILAGCPAMSDAHVAAVRRFVARGGRLCVLGPLATHDEWMFPRKEPALTDLPEDCVFRFETPREVETALNTALDGKPLLRISAKSKAVPQNPVLTKGHRFFTDRDYGLVEAPPELLGCRTIQTSHTEAKTDSAITLIVREPLRVFVAFAPESAETAWLKPRPGWKLYKPAALKTTMGTFGAVMDIHYRDLPQSETVLFEGLSGNYVPVAVQSLADKTKPADFSLHSLSSERKRSAPLGLCVELTQRKSRRLVHLVNYRDDGPVEDIRVALRLPPHCQVDGVSTAGPDHEEDVELEWEQKGREVTFSVPKVDVYEVAVVRLR